MGRITIFLLSLLMLIGGAFFFAFYHGLIVLQMPKNNLEAFKSTKYEKKTITLYYYLRNSWHKEDTETLWSSDNALSAQYILNNWLNLLDEEGVTAKKVSLQTTLLSSSGSELYISFDRSPLRKESSIYEKLMLIESLLKTFNENGLKFSFLHFLVHHQPMKDTHLDFARAWPCEGFLT